MNSTNPLPALFVGGVTVRQDKQGRYFLNDLHKASGGHQKDDPAHWLRHQQTKDLIDEIRNSLIISDIQNSISDKNNNLEPINSVRSFTEEQGTYVVKELVYAYAMWISPQFMLHVIRTFDATVTQQLEQARLKLENSVPWASFGKVVNDKAKMSVELAELKAKVSGLGKPRYWTYEEDMHVVAGLLDGKGITKIACELFRTPDSVRHRYRKRLKSRVEAFKNGRGATIDGEVLS